MVNFFCLRVSRSYVCYLLHFWFFWLSDPRGVCAKTGGNSKIAPTLYHLSVGRVICGRLASHGTSAPPSDPYQEAYSTVERKSIDPAQCVRAHVSEILTANQLQQRADRSINQESPFSRVIGYVSISISTTLESWPLLSYPCLFTTPSEALSSHILSLSPKKSLWFMVMQKFSIGPIPYHDQNSENGGHGISPMILRKADSFREWNKMRIQVMMIIWERVFADRMDMQSATLPFSWTVLQKLPAKCRTRTPM